MIIENLTLFDCFLHNFNFINNFHLSKKNSVKISVIFHKLIVYNEKNV